MHLNYLSCSNYGAYIARSQAVYSRLAFEVSAELC